jgi:hypothetical protein
MDVRKAITIGCAIFTSVQNSERISLSPVRQAYEIRRAKRRVTRVTLPSDATQRDDMGCRVERIMPH